MRYAAACALRRRKRTCSEQIAGGVRVDFATDRDFADLRLGPSLHKRSSCWTVGCERGNRVLGRARVRIGEVLSMPLDALRRHASQLALRCRNHTPERCAMPVTSARTGWNAGTVKINPQLTFGRALWRDSEAWRCVGGGGFCCGRELQPRCFSVRSLVSPRRLDRKASGLKLPPTKTCRAGGPQRRRLRMSRARTQTTITLIMRTAVASQPGWRVSA